MTLFICGCTTQESKISLNLVKENNLSQGLNLFTASVSEGINGAYVNNNHTIYFKAKRGGKNPFIERFLFDAPTYAVDAGYFADNGDFFEGSIGGDALNNQSWFNGTSPEIDSVKRTEDFRTTWLVANSLEKLSLPAELKWEKEALIQTARSMKESDLVQNN